jgi:hypothetical protein
MSYFHKAGWPRKWISTAEDALCKEWVLNYKPDIPTTNTKTTVSNMFANKRTDYISCTGVFNDSSSRNKYFEMFDAFNVSATTGDALDEWLATPPIPNITNPLGYWCAMAASGHPLVPMAKDFLSVPGKLCECFSVI